ncbi:hypothetical protein [Enterobacter bugandensis]|uniref:hypothetical protein n=1 Tax=Enterobacter bugandensis TaxID=881260 RepID=UPI0022E2B5E9|nr:hypothetical protein [Enterobacter bugandensis]
MAKRQFSALAIILAGLIICEPANAQDAGQTAAESLLSTSDNTGWSLEEMVSSRKANNPHTGSDIGGISYSKVRLKEDDAQGKPSTSASSAPLRHKLADLKAALEKERRHEVTLSDALTRAKKARVSLANTPDPKLSALSKKLDKQVIEADVFRSQINNLKAELKDRNQKLMVLSESQNILRHDIADKDTALLAATKELNLLKAKMVRKEELPTKHVVTTKVESSQDTDILQKVKALKAELAKKEAVLTLLKKTAEGRDENLKILQSGLDAKNRTISDLNAALEARNSELKQAATTLTTLREKQMRAEDLIVTSDATHSQSYMAGQMMARELSKRLDGWKQAGVSTDMRMFRDGLIDGLQGKIRLEPNEARRAQESFTDAVQSGAVRAVVTAQKQLETLSNGRQLLKSHGGINWYRVRKGKNVVKGGPVSLALTEKVVGGKVISRIPALIVRPDDGLPSIVKDGMYLPGEGGEVVGYGLARSVYGALPLPEGVQPFTVMEYHLTGSPVRPVPPSVERITTKR